MDERIAKHAADIAAAAVSVRELARVAGVLSTDVNQLVDLAGQAVDQVHATSLGDDTIASFEAATADLDQRAGAAKDAEASLAAKQADIESREAAVTDREKAADARETELNDLAAGLEVREKKLADEAAAKVESNGNKSE